MIESIFLISAASMLYPIPGAVIFRKIFFKIKSEKHSHPVDRAKWDSEDKYFWTMGCMAGALLWPVAGFFVGLYYFLTSKQATPWEKEQLLIKLKQENNRMERELGIGKYAPSDSNLMAEILRKTELNGWKR
jgi:hypothetical protein